MSMSVPTTNGIPSDLLRDLVTRVVRAAAPERIILFGSAARGEATTDSDIDILVVKRCVQRRALVACIYRALVGVGRAVDVVVATPKDLARYQDSPATVIAPALREGKVLYAA